jgi:hypothetical protein
MKRLKLTLILAAFVLTASFAYAQDTQDEKSSQTSNYVDSITVAAKSIPNPNIYLGKAITGGRITREELLENPVLSVKDPNFEIEWNIVSYKVTFVRYEKNSDSGVEDPPIMVVGAEFTEQIKSRIQSAPSGTIMEISDIKIQSIAGYRETQHILSVRIR